MTAARSLSATEPVSLDPSGPSTGSFARTVGDTAAGPIPNAADDATAITRILDWVQTVGASAPTPGAGRTRELWEGLAKAAALDVGLARALEPHLDARAILGQADGGGSQGFADAATWGVFAAEGPGPGLRARRHDGGWRLSGLKPWCSLAGSLSHALVTAWVDEERRGLFAVDLHASGVSPSAGPWVSRGLDWVVSAPVEFDDVDATPVGEPGWYLTRPGFAWGGIGVAAAWWGGALPLAARLREAAASERADQVGQAAAGEADALMWGARSVLSEAAHAIDSAAASAAPALWAARVRAVVVHAVERTLDLAERTLGPAPLTVDEDYARRIADLRIYVRQDHGTRDLARIGRMVAS